MGRNRDPVHSGLKRVLDIGVAAVVLVVSSPVLATAAAVVRLRLGGPVLYRQERPGMDGQLFRIVKLRTMTDERGPDGHLLPDADRLTPLGVALRRSSIDELPELWNVLRGDMSLVGPRPLLPRYTPYLRGDEALRLSVRPGITGWAQVNGRNDSPWDVRLAHDVWYVRNWSFRLDLQILLRTVSGVLTSRGVVADAESVLANLDDERRGASA